MSLFEIPCRCCGERNVELVLDLGDQPHCNRLVRPGDPDPPAYPLRLGFCNTCTLVQIDHTIPKEDMFSNDYPYVSGTTNTLRAHFAESTRNLRNMYDVGDDDLVVDIGSNDGTWLSNWHCHTLGIEPARNVWDIALERGIPTWNRFMNVECAKDILRHHRRHPKLVTAAGVFFHLEELHSVIEACELLIIDGGVLVVQCIYLGDMIDNLSFDQIYHEHLCYYTLRSLMDLVGRHGMYVHDAKMLPIHGGTIEAHISACGKNVRDTTDDVWTIMKHELAMGYGDVATYHKFAKNVTSSVNHLRCDVASYALSGHRIWAYGAPAKGATLLNTAKIGRDLVTQAVEKNPMKVGFEIPGCRIPIVAESDEHPDAYLLLAWNFWDEIREKERAFIDNGGTFIIPTDWRE